MTDRDAEGEKADYRPVIGLTLVSLLLCGLFFPLLVTAVSQAVLPFQANGEQVRLNGRTVGLSEFAQNFTLPIFFHPRNDSASGADPDITVSDAMSQAPRISNATGIPLGSLQRLIDENTDPQGTLVELRYVNVLSLNVQLIQGYPSAYSAFQTG
jgi:K+-transporting ATPase ATPase C chain